jgi:hypothetical protein
MTQGLGNPLLIECQYCKHKMFIKADFCPHCGKTSPTELTGPPPPTVDEAHHELLLQTGTTEQVIQEVDRELHDGPLGPAHPDPADDAVHLGRLLREAVHSLALADATPRSELHINAAYLAVQRLVHAYQGLSIDQKVAIRTRHKHPFLEALAGRKLPTDDHLFRIFQGASAALDRAQHQDAVFELAIEAELIAARDPATAIDHLHTIVGKVLDRLGMVPA